MSLSSSSDHFVPRCLFFSPPCLVLYTARFFASPHSSGLFQTEKRISPVFFLKTTKCHYNFVHCPCGQLYSCKIPHYITKKYWLPLVDGGRSCPDRLPGRKTSMCSSGFSVHLAHGRFLLVLLFALTRALFWTYRSFRLYSLPCIG